MVPRSQRVTQINACFFRKRVQKVTNCLLYMIGEGKLPNLEKTLAPVLGEASPTTTLRTIALEGDA